MWSCKLWQTRVPYGVRVEQWGHELLLRLFTPGHVTLGSGVWLSTVLCVASQ